ncbi:MAG: hypothetical protein ACLSVD_16025 [Eggerthellaceae bacterium]
MEATLRKTGALLGRTSRTWRAAPCSCAAARQVHAVLPLRVRGQHGGRRRAATLSLMLVSWSLLFTTTMVASVATLAALAEEKEKHTLRTLMLANVSAEQMLASAAS